ncbi:DUF2236 domain-containing protein [Bailinhaonella thermotolerans]|uniref:DUF2236 domain-containing protein n=2 Tax=Bailinhaonella thermotolerans TaxID=1070861 RepID=A0A3A4A860_9ACTN|nr:DUF2236 domain-containing protein [Bailinhaonella thermotolerans]
MMLVLGSALVEQVAHPQIGAAVGQQSVYRSDPWGRLTRSLDSLQKWVYGGEAALAEGRRLRELHKDIQGVDDQGRRYHALSAEPYAWVFLTAFDRAITMARYFDTPYDRAGQERLYAEILRLGRILRVPDRVVPQTVSEYWDYFDDMVAHTLENHPTCHDVLRTALGVQAPPFVPRSLRAAWVPVGWSSGRFNHFLMVGTLPPALRAKLGLSWTAQDERRLRRIGRVIAETVPLLPERVRYLPIAYHAREAARSRARLEIALRGR